MINASHTYPHHSSTVKKLLCVIAASVLLVGNNLYAATWKVIDEDSVAIHYIDTSSVEDVGASIVRLVVLTNFKHRYVPMVSSVDVMDFKCGKVASKMVRSDTFTELYGGGRHIGTLTPESFGENPNEFFPIGQDKDSVLVHREYDFACKTKYSFDDRLHLNIFS